MCGTTADYQILAAYFFRRLLQLIKILFDIAVRNKHLNTANSHNHKYINFVS